MVYLFIIVIEQELFLKLEVIWLYEKLWKIKNIGRNDEDNIKKLLKLLQRIK